MADTQILSIVTFIYLGGFVAYLIHVLTGKAFWGLLGSGALAVGFLAHTAALLLRWRAAYAVGYNHPPLTNFYESLIFFSWAIILLYIMMEWRTRTRILGLFVVPVAFLCLAFASLSPDMNTRIQPLIPALQSNWLTSHVLTCFMGYAAFTTAFGAGLLYLIGDFGKGGAGTVRDCSPDPAAGHAGGTDLQERPAGLYPPDARHLHRFRLGALRLGFLLELGPEGNLVSHHLADLCDPPARPLCPGLAGRRLAADGPGRFRLLSCSPIWASITSRDCTVIYKGQVNSRQDRQDR